jgi:hypothetical protein
MLVLKHLVKYNIKSVRHARQINRQCISSYSSNIGTTYKAIIKFTKYTKWRLIYELNNDYKCIYLIYSDNRSGHEILYDIRFTENYLHNYYHNSVLTVDNPLAESTIKIKKQIFTSEYSMLTKWAGL